MHVFTPSQVPLKEQHHFYVRYIGKTMRDCKWSVRAGKVTIARARAGLLILICELYIVAMLLRYVGGECCEQLMNVCCLVNKRVHLFSNDYFDINIALYLSFSLAMLDF